MLAFKPNNRFYFNLFDPDDEGNITFEQISLFRIIEENDFVFCPSYLNDYFETYLKTENLNYEIIPFDIVIDSPTFISF